MKKISCNVYQDILPLYVDGVVSEDTKAFVDEHLAECENCRAELKKMSQTIDLPAENETKPFEEIKKQWARKNTLIWGLSLALIAIFMLMSLPVFDTAMQYHIQEIIGGSIQNLLIMILPLAVVGFALEWWFIHLKKCRWLSLIPLIVPAVALIFAEFAWASGGWDRFGSTIFWALGFPVLLGAGLAALLKATLEQPLWAKITVAAFLAVFVALTVIFWPKNIDSTIGLEPDTKLLAVYTDGETEWLVSSAEALEQELKFAKIAPCNSAPNWTENRCIIVRLNESYVLVAPHADTPYVYEYSGALEDFNGQDVAYKLFNYSALYINLKTASSVQE